MVYSRICLPQRTQPTCSLIWTRLRVITWFTALLGPRRNLELTRKFCSADIICRVSLYVIFLSPGKPWASERNITISISLFQKIVHRHFTLISVLLSQLSLGKRRRSGRTLRRWRDMRDSNVLHTVCCKRPPLKSQECFRGISLCGCRKLGRQGHIRGSMTRGPASVATIPMLQPGTWVTPCPLVSSLTVDTWDAM